jgi:uncharacterized protein YoaH (UPF0181 family)
MKQHAGEAIDAKARVRSAGETIAHTAHGLRANERGRRTTAHFIGEQARNLKAWAPATLGTRRRLYDEYPAAGAIGVAIGAIIGATAR